MAAKSIIEIEVLDDKFREFKKLFDDYKDMLQESVIDWGNSDKAIERNRKTLKNQLDDERKRDKERKKAEQERKKADDETIKRWKQIREITTDTVKTIGKIGLATGLTGMGLAGMLTAGMSNLAQNASNVRRQSMGLGINAGAMKAAEVNYSSALSNPLGTMSAIRDMQADITKQRLFLTAGVQNYQKKSAAEVMPELMRAAQKMAKQTPREQLAQVSEAYGYSDVFSIEDLTRFKEMADAEMEKTIRKAQSDEKGLAVSNALLEKWQLLQKQIDRFTESIQGVLLNALAPLAPLFTKLSESTLAFFKAFMKSDLMKFLLENLTAGLKQFTEYLSGDQPVKDIKKFIGYIKEGAGYFSAFFDVIKMVSDGWKLLWNDIIKPTFTWIGEKFGFAVSGDAATTYQANAGSIGSMIGGAVYDFFNPAKSTARQTDAEWDRGGKVSTNKKGGVSIPESTAIAFFKQRGYSTSEAAAIVTSLKVESGLSTNPEGWNDGGKAFGMAQWHKDRQANFAKAFPGKDIRSATPEQQLAFVDWELKNTHKHALDAMRKAQTTYDKAGAISRYYEGPADVYGEMAKRGRMAEKMERGYGNPVVIQRGEKDLQGRVIPQAQSPVFKSQQGQNNMVGGSNNMKLIIENPAGANINYQAAALR